MNPIEQMSLKEQMNLNEMLVRLSGRVEDWTVAKRGGRFTVTVEMEDGRTLVGKAGTLAEAVSEVEKADKQWPAHKLPPKPRASTWAVDFITGRERGVF